MVKHSKLVYVIGSIIIGIITILGILGGLILGGVIDGTTKKVVFVSGSMEKTYDGTPLTCDEFVLQSGELKKGHTAHATISGTQTGAGSSANVFEVVILDTNGADVSSDYEIALNPGTLTVAKRPLELSADSASKVYDGTALTNESYTLTSGELVAGHYLDVTYVGEIIKAGEASNQVSALVKDVEDNDVTCNYELTYIEGTLTVTQKPITLLSETYNKVYDGTALTGMVDGYSITEGELVSGHEISLTCVGTQTNVGVTQNEVSAAIVSGTEDLTANYLITYSFGTLTVEQRRIEITSANADKEYDGTPLTCSDWTLTVGTVAPDQNLTVTCTGTVTDCGQKDNDFTYTITNNLNEDVSSNYLVETVKGLLTVGQRIVRIQTESASKVYDGTPLYKEDGWLIVEGSIAPNQEIFVIDYSKITNVFDGLVKNELSFIVKEGDVDRTLNYTIIQEYGELKIDPKEAIVTTASDRRAYNGEPLTKTDGASITGVLSNETANFTVTGKQTDAGNSKNTYSVVVTNIDGVVTTANYVFTEELGTLTVDKLKISLTSKTAEKVYDGKPLTCNEVDLVGALADGETIEYSFSESLTNAGGPVENRFTYNIYKKDGVSSSNENYDVEGGVQFGTLTVNKREICLKSQSQTKIYDGVELKLPDVEITNGSTVDGETLTTYAKGTITNVGEVQNTIVYNVVNANGQPTTDNYKFVEDTGVLKIDKRRIEITSANAEKEYDGTALTCSEWNLSVGAIVPNQTLKVVCTGSITNVGGTDNGFTYTITNALNEEVSSNYQVDYKIGTLTVTKREVVLKSQGQTKVYDGVELKLPGVEITGGSIVDGETLIAYAKGAITNVGEVENTIDYRVENAYGQATTNNYKFVEDTGTLKVEQKVIVLTTQSDSKTYDGTPLTKTDGAQILGELVENESATITVSGSRTDVGEDYNIATVKITKLDGTDSTANYYVDEEFGKLMVNPIEVQVISGSAMKMYNAKLQSYNHFDVLGALLPNHEVDETTIQFVGGFIDVGSYLNEFNENGVKVVDSATGEDVSKYYKITPKYGSVVIFTKEIEVRTSDAAKVYDGTPLTKKEYTATGLIDGHEVIALVTGTITNPGKAVNTFIIDDIVDAEGNSVRHNYDVKDLCGTLQVTTSEMSGGEGASGDISSLGGAEPEEVPMYIVNADFGGRVYLKITSYGDYFATTSGSKWLDPVAYTGATTVSPLSYPYLALNDYAKVGQISIEKINAGASFVTPYYADLSLTGANDISYYISDSKYSMSYIFAGDNAYVKNALSGTIYQQQEEDYFNYVKETYLQLPDSTRAVMEKVIKVYGLSTDNPYLIEEVASIVQTKVSYSFDYEYKGDVAEYFFTQAKTGICQHYATAATALFRALGIPARYTVGFAGEVKAGVDNVINSPGHAWVEVYIQGFGWVPVEVTGSSSSGGGGGGTAEQEAIFVKPLNVYKQGNATTVLTYTSKELEGDEFKKLCEANGYTYTFNVNGVQRGVGKTVSKIENFVLYDSNGQDITKQYNFNFSTGIMHVYLQSITVRTVDVEKYYDGKPLRNDPNAIAYEIDYGETGTLMFGHQVTTVEMKTVITDVGSISNSVSNFVITDQEGNDVTDFYKVNYLFGKLTIKARAICVTTGSKTVSLSELNGEALICHEYTITSLCGFDDSPLVDGDVETVKFTAELKVAGRKNNTATITIKNLLNQDVTKNYSIKYTYGRLVVNK